MHRTEVTEVTEGGLGGVRETFAGDIRWPACENLAKEECIAQRSRRSQRGLGVVRETFAGDSVGLRARISRKRNASHSGHAGHGGGLGVVRETFAEDSVGLHAKIPQIGKASMILRFPARKQFSQNNFQCLTRFPPSVTSVRCFPLFAWFSHGSRRCPPNSFPGLSF